MNLLKELIGVKAVEKSLEQRVIEAIKASGITIKDSKLLEAQHLIPSPVDVKHAAELEKIAGTNNKVFRLYDNVENPFIDKIARALKIHDGGNLKRIDDKCYAVYHHGGELAFYTDPNDYDED